MRICYMRLPDVRLFIFLQTNTIVTAIKVWSDGSGMQTIAYETSLVATKRALFVYERVQEHKRTMRHYTL